MINYNKFYTREHEACFDDVFTVLGVEEVARLAYLAMDGWSNDTIDWALEVANAEWPESKSVEHTHWIHFKGKEPGWISITTDQSQKIVFRTSSSLEAIKEGVTEQVPLEWLKTYLEQ